MNIPDIKVQLIHIDGPLKGEINDFCQSVIALGRHPECQIVFPEDCTAISREHASIKREGNRFKLIDHSTNGTLVNGKQQKEFFLHDGDVLLIGGENGAKVSFLTQKISPEEAAAIALATVEKNNHEHGMSPAPSASSVPPVQKVHETPEPVQPSTQPPLVSKTLTIQHGATLNSYKKLPITIGSSSDCDLTLAHPDVLERHAQIFFLENQYWIKDLTGRGLLTVNMVPVESGVVLEPDAQLNLTPQGPSFTFLGGGRLAEVEKEVREQGSPPVSPAKSPVKKKVQKSKPSLMQSAGGKNLLLWIVVIALGLILTLGAWWILYSQS